MPNLQQFQAKQCDVSAGVLIHDEKVLFIHHKKLDLWLPPGGHIEANELPHQAAEREFFEETGVKVKAISAHPLIKSTITEYLPMPFACNLHWISEKNYQNRRQDGQDHGCEQHYCWIYLVEAIGSLDLFHNAEETHDLGWFSRKEIRTLNTTPDIRDEITLAFKLIRSSLGK